MLISEHEAVKCTVSIIQREFKDKRINSFDALFFIPSPISYWKLLTPISVAPLQWKMSTLFCITMSYNNFNLTTC